MILMKQKGLFKHIISLLMLEDFVVHNLFTKTSVGRQLVSLEALLKKHLFKIESTQIAHSGNQSVLQPIVTSAVMERLQVDLIDY